MHNIAAFSRTYCWPNVLDLWDSKFVRVLDTGASNVALSFCDVVLLVEVLPVFVEVDQFLVQRLIEQLGILQTSLDIAVLPETNPVRCRCSPAWY